MQWIGKCNWRKDYRIVNNEHGGEKEIEREREIEREWERRNIIMEKLSI